jgi:hypothetical protein
MKELMESWRKFASEAENEDAHGRVEEALPAALAGAARIASKTGAVADKVGKVAGTVKTGADLVKKILPDDDEDEETTEEELEEWNAEDEKNGKYPSRKQRKRNKYMLKPDRSSWVPGADELAKGGLTKGYVGMSEAKKKKERKKQCHAYNPFHGKDGEFVNPESEAGSYSMKKPDSNSPDDCTWGQARRSSPNRSTQSTKRDCGRKGPYVCKDGRKKYEEKLLQLEKIIDPDLNEGNQEQLEAYLSGVISRELERAIQKHMNKQGCSFNQLVRALYAWNSAEKGKDTSSKN